MPSCTRGVLVSGTCAKGHGRAASGKVGATAIANGAPYMDTIIRYGLPVALSALTFLAFAVLAEILRRRLGFDPAARIAGVIDNAIPRAAVAVTS